VPSVELEEFGAEALHQPQSPIEFLGRLELLLPHSLEVVLKKEYVTG
jgi:hypothetical protein